MKITVTECADCPACFAIEEWGVAWCQMREEGSRKIEEYPKATDEPHPEWCPLRQGSVTIELTDPDNV